MIGPRLGAAMAESIATRIAACELDLKGAIVLTEAANGAFATTAAAALAAGAEVFALARASRWASAEVAEADVRALSRALGADLGRLHLVRDRSNLPAERADIVTNSGHLRPLDAGLIGRLRPGSVIALMFEAWELREGDIDLRACAEGAVTVVGVDEHHRACDAFAYVGAAALTAAACAGWSVSGRPVAVVTDSPFAPYVLRALEAWGAVPVIVCPDGADVSALSGGVRAAVVPWSEADRGLSPRCDLAVLCTWPEKVARHNGRAGVRPERTSALVASTGAHGVVQLWGDLDRAALAAHGVEALPSDDVAPGYMGVRLDAAGFEPVVRLLVAGLAAAAEVRFERPGVGLAQPVRTDESRTWGV
jgi:hypothetical protein